MTSCLLFMQLSRAKINPLFLCRAVRVQRSTLRMCGKS